MSYTPTTWKSGDTVTSAKLNKMEQGIASASEIFIVTEDTETGMLNKTFSQIREHQISGLVLLIDPTPEQCGTKILKETNINEDDNEYQVAFGEENNLDWYIATSEDGYPSFSQDTSPK